MTITMAKLLIHEPPLQVLPTLAVEIGLNEAIVLQQLHYWLENQKVGFEKDGLKWVANTYEEWQGNFPFWSVPTIKRIFAALEERGLVISGQFEKSDWNQRKAYRIAYDTLDSINLIRSKDSERSPLNKNTETTTETTTQKPKTQLPANSDIGFMLAAGMTSESIAEANLKDATERDLLMFYEKQMGYGTTLDWWGKNEDLVALRKFLVGQTREDIETFAKWCKEKYNKFKPVDAARWPRQVMIFWPMAFEGQNETSFTQTPPKNGSGFYA